MLNPEWNRNEGLVPHSCGEVCGRPLATTAQCPHTCLDLCHPGPCNPCQASLRKTCPCGSLTRVTRCDTDLLCGGECGKLLSCGRHSCTATCHVGACQDCEERMTTECHCGKTSQDRQCTADSAEKFSCGEVCGLTLDCDNHQCEAVCHPGDCAPCPLSPDRVTTCPCGKTLLQGDRARTSCTDDIPLCGAVCDKLLPCGPPLLSSQVSGQVSPGALPALPPQHHSKVQVWLHGPGAPLLSDDHQGGRCSLPEEVSEEEKLRATQVWGALLHQNRAPVSSPV